MAKKYFNCSKIKRVELEDESDFSSGVHWKARILLGEYMTPIYTDQQVISEFTLAFLEDTGYYKVNHYTGGLMRYGKNKGCKFVEEKSAKNYEIDPYYENEFFDTIYSDSNYDSSCTSGRQSRSYFYFQQYNNSIPYYYRYFGKTKEGGLKIADYCPVSKYDINEENYDFYDGRCSNLGLGEYG